jgi:hypothetical protein
MNCPELSPPPRPDNLIPDVYTKANKAIERIVHKPPKEVGNNKRAEHDLNASNKSLTF